MNSPRNLKARIGFHSVNRQHDRNRIYGELQQLLLVHNRSVHHHHDRIYVCHLIIHKIQEQEQQEGNHEEKNTNCNRPKENIIIHDKHQSEIVLHASGIFRITRGGMCTTQLERY
jgi:hypothetical protein